MQKTSIFGQFHVIFAVLLIFIPEIPFAQESNTKFLKNSALNYFPIYIFYFEFNLVGFR